MICIQNKWFSWFRPAMSDRKAEQCSQFVGKEQSGALATDPDIIAVLLKGGNSRQIITEGGENLREAVLRKVLLRYKESGWRRRFPPTFAQKLRAFCCFILQNIAIALQSHCRFLPFGDRNRPAKFADYAI